MTGGWPAGIGIALRADALAVLFAVLSVAVLAAALAYEVLLGVHERTLPALVLFLAAGLTGLFLTADVFNFFVFFEVSMTAAFVLASYGRARRELRAALIFTVVNLLGSIMFLTAAAALYRLTGTLDMAAVARHLRDADAGAGLLVGVLVFVALSLKLGLFPFHFWLPPMYRDTWPSIAAVLSGAVANVGSYGLIRFAGILPDALAIGAPVLVALGGASILYGAHQAVSVRTAAEALAYSAIGQAGYIMVALALGGAAGPAAAVLYAVVNAANKTLLFLAAGLRGWLVGLAFIVGALSVAGIPPSAGFVGKVALFRIGLAADRPVIVALFVLGAALSFVYMFQVYQREYWAGEAAGAPSSRSVRGLVLALAVGVLGLGVWPQPLVSLSDLAASAHAPVAVAGR